jgi:hypothetical protein
VATNPCIVNPDSRYRGPENQLYRVEVHRGSMDAAGKATQPTFTWSRENGSVVFPIVSGGGTSVVTLESLGRDDRFGLAEGDWVEVEDDDSVLLGQAGTLLKIVSVDAARLQVTLSGTPDPSVGNDTTKHPLLRRWDQTPTDQTDAGTGRLVLADDHAAIIPNDGSWLDLEDGVQVQFVVRNAPAYRTGDYWLIPARTSTGDVEWPTEPAVDPQKNPTAVPAALPPFGPTHHYAPLALVQVASAGITTTPCQMQFSIPVEPVNQPR